MTRTASLAALLVLSLSTLASADDAPPPDGEPPPPKKGDFDAGGKLRFPSGPDEMGEYGTFNWIGFDAYGKYFVTDFITVSGQLPLAPKHPDIMGATDDVEPSIFGGFTVRPEILLGRSVGIGATVGFLHEGAILQTEKDFPYYFGSLTPAASIGPWIKFKKWGLFFDTAPSVIMQKKGDVLPEGVLAATLPVSAAVSVKNLFKLGLETIIATGDGFKFKAEKGGKIALGVGLDLKISHIKLHLGTGFASLLADDTPSAEALVVPYESVGKSLYFDLNAKYVK